MKLIKVAAAALNQTPLDWDGNQANILGALVDAKAKGATVVCLPELCITGYGCEDAFLSPGVVEMAGRVLLEIAPHTEGMIASLGLPVLHEGGLYNAACLLADGEILGLACKRHLAREGIHYEPRWFRPWPAGGQAEIEMGGKSYPLGDLIFDCGGVKIGFEICEDAWVAERPGAELAVAGVDVILNPSASHFAFDKQDVRRHFVLDGSRAFSASYVYANLLGNEAGRAIYDGGNMIASAGHMIAEQPRFSMADRQVTTALIDVDSTRIGRLGRSGFQPSQEHPRHRTISCDWKYPEITPEPQAVNLPVWEESEHRKEEEFARSVSLGLLDYLRKSRSGGFVVSLSGGADSSTVAMLIALLVKFGLAELGRDRLIEKLSNVAGIEEAGDERSLLQRLLTCVYQSTKNSSETTRQAASVVAETIGAKFLQLDVDPMVAQYTQAVEKVIGRTLDWETDDLALQNIQARARAPGVWLLANLSGSLLLATSNRSEAAVGYATMDGDTSGGLSPIAGIDKAFLRRWLQWMESTGPEAIGPEPALNAVNRQQPTAELRPSEAAQTDEGDLMPYEVLDTIERAAIRDKQMPLEVLRIVEPTFPQHTRAQLGFWVERFFRLWSRNQWKRERYAPSFHLDDENLDPKTWCRFPILSGGFQRELKELREYLDRADS